MYRCLLVDETETLAPPLHDRLAELSIFGQLTTCLTYTDAVSTLLQETFDLVFLTVESNAEEGLSLLKPKKRPPVIVLSTHPHHAVACYDLDVADYLQPPFDKSRLLRSIHRALGISVHKENIVTSEVIFLKVGRRLQKFAFNHIDYIEAYGVYCKIHHKGKIEVVNEPIMVLEERFPLHHFRRIHKSFIVNLDHITSYSHNSFFIDEAKIPIGISYRDHLPNIYRLLG